MSSSTDPCRQADGVLAAVNSGDSELVHSSVRGLLLRGQLVRSTSVGGLVVMSHAWTGADAHALRLSMGLSIEEFAAALEVAPRTVAYWSSRPDSTPRQAIQGLLDRLQHQHSEQRRQAVRPSRTTDPVLEETDRFLAQTAEIMSTIGSDGIDLLTVGVQGLARTYNSRSLIDEFNAAADLQRQAHSLLDRTSRPGEISDLYVTIAQLGALMASCAFDLGRSEQATRLSTASLMFADRGGDPSMTAWILGLRASLDLWGARPLNALGHVDRGLARAAAGQPRFRLLHIGARAAAAADDRDRAVELLQLADHELTCDSDDRLADDVGGEFHFDRGRAAACASATWLMLGDWDQVQTTTHQAIDHYTGASGHSRVPMLGARLDLASALVHCGDIAAAEEQMRAAFAEAAEHRYSLVARVEQVAAQLRRRSAERRAVTALDVATDWLHESP